jgi:hypothetical protein
MISIALYTLESGPIDQTSLPLYFRMSRIVFVISTGFPQTDHVVYPRYQHEFSFDYADADLEDLRLALPSGDFWGALLRELSGIGRDLVLAGRESFSYMPAMWPSFI